MSKHLPVHPRTGETAIGIVAGRPVWPVKGGAPTRAEEIRTRQAAIRTDLDALETQLTGDNVDNVDELHTRSDALLAEWDELTTELEPLAERENRIAQVRATMQTEGNRENGFGAPTPIINRVGDPFRDMDRLRSGQVPASDIRARALTAVEQFSKRNDGWHLEDEAAKEATRKIERMGANFGTAAARHMLETGTPEYLAHFQAYLQDPQGYAQRAAMSLTNVNGGYLVPFTLDPTIILTNQGSANPYRQVANIKTTATNDWNGVTSAGVTAEWTAEGTEAADASPTVGPLKITPVKADAYVFGSVEVIEDSDFAQQLPVLMADAKDRLEETAFAIGTGSTQPNGVIPRGTALVQGAGAGAVIRQQDVYALQGALPARWRGPNARNVWLANLSSINALRQIAKFAGSTQSIVDDSGSTSTMLGKPLLESTSIVGAGNGNKVLAYLDGQQFYIVDRIGVSMIYDPLGVIGNARRMPTGQSSWYMFWRVGSDVSVQTAVRVLQLTT